MKFNNTADHCNAGSTVCLQLKSLVILLVDRVSNILDGHILFSYLVATLSGTGIAGLHFEASGHLQSPLIGKTMGKEREMATNLSPEQNISHSSRRKLEADKLTYDKRGAITDFFSIGCKLS